MQAGLLTNYQIDAIGQGGTQPLRVGNYDVLDRLGAGGMGTVFKARHRRMKRVVALKVLSADLCLDASFVLRFQREVETIARLSHPNIVMAYDADEAEVGHFLVMEFVDGRDLASVVESDGPMSVSGAIDCIQQAATGLAYAHGQGIIHRDIKPHNLLLARSGVLKVTDLGLARLAVAPGQASSSLTKAGGLLGTTTYMPPEQASDPTQIDHRADIYALGCTLYFLLTGTPPFDGPSLMSVLIKHRESTPPSLAQTRPDVPVALDDLFQRMMAKEPGNRPQTMTEVTTALVPLAEQAQTWCHWPIGGGPVSVSDPTAVGQVTPIRLMSAEPDAPVAPPLAVLIVEPSRVQGGIIRKYLEAKNVSVVGVFASGREALAAVQASPPSCLVSSLHLPDMTGLELAQKVRSEVPGSPGFILISSEADAAGASLSQYQRALMLHKPFTSEQLIEAVSVVTGRTVEPRAASGTDSQSLASPSSEVPSSDRPRADRSHLHVLIVDDSAAARLHERNTLQELGFAEFTEASDGAQAVAAISTALSPFALIVTDYNMPLMDGRALLGYLKQSLGSDVPVLMVTTETDPEVLASVRALGVAGLLPKSFSAAQVEAVLRKLF